MSDLISRSEEEWRAIPEYEGIYEVSNFGNVRSLPRYKRGNFDSKVFIEGKAIKQVKNNRGYYIVQLSKNNKVKNFSVHRLVATAFIPNPNSFPQINHKDEDKTNNRASNLEWTTLKRNINYGTRNKRMALTKGKNVKAFDDDGNFIMGFCSMAVAEKITGINQGDISRCTLGKTEHAGGYVWKIVNQGDVSDDVCEWKKDDMCETVYMVCGGCFTSEYQKDFKYCPYCGKKIKVVE